MLNICGIYFIIGNDRNQIALYKYENSLSSGILGLYI